MSLRARQILLPALVAALLLHYLPEPLVEARSKTRPANSIGTWQSLKRSPAASIQPPVSPGTPGALPTIRQPANGFQRPTSRSMDWYTLGDSAKIRMGIPGQKLPLPMRAESFDALSQPIPVPRFPLAQLPASAPTPTPTSPSPVSPVTGAVPQGLVPPTTAPARGEMQLDTEFRLPEGMNIRIRSMDFRDTDVRDVLRSLSALVNLNLMLSNNISGAITIMFNDVTMEEAFSTVMKNADLGFTWDRTILRIFPMAQAPTVTQVFNIQNANAAAIKPMVDRILTSGRQSEIDARTNSLIVTDTQAKIDQVRLLLPQIDIQSTAVEVTSRPITEVFYLDYVDANNMTTPIRSVAPDANITAYSSTQASQAGAGGTATGRQDIMIITDTQANIDKIREIIEKLDVAPVQVTIDAHIYEIDLNEEERMGINWQKSIPIPGTTENIFDMSISPEEATAGGTGVFRFGSLNVNQFRALLAMLKTKTFAKVLSNPVITTLNNRQANITVGQAIPYISASTVNAETGQVSNTVSQANANIQLQVTPSVTGNDEVFLDITPTISSVLGFTSLGGNSTPNLSNRTAQTQVIVKNNHTIVIGGMIKTDKSDTLSKVPILGDLPGIGRLFQKKTLKEIRTELIIFITPHIVRNHGGQKRHPQLEAQLPKLSVQP
ncbi:MAG TPA: secretin N-terminal domain-containing protein [Candidatus Ozemobacteraceae bacterium]|nr:secretin N-terminal domain-containing protein [Candidatus Ozemobacteraceae bacterium]